MDKKAFFNEMAPGWEQRFYSPEKRKYLSAIFSQLSIPPGARILDIGTGTGGIIPYLLQAAGPRGAVRAIDFAPRMVKIGAEKFRREPRVIFLAGSVEFLPFPGEYFDYIMCFGAFPHFEDKLAALKEMGRVLKDGGPLVVLHALGSAEIRETHRKIASLARDFLPEEPCLRELLKEARFRLVRLTDQSGLYLCETRKAATGEVN